MEENLNSNEKKSGREIVFSVFKTAARIVTVLGTLLIGFCIGYIACMIKPWNKLESSSGGTTIVADSTISASNYNLTIENVEKIIKPASDLITSNYNYKDADKYENYKTLFEKRVPLTTDETIFTYEGKVSVGIDLSDVDYAIDNEHETIIVTIPEIAIISNEIFEDTFEYPFESDSVFNSTDMEDYTNLLSTLKKKKADEVSNDTDFMDDAKQKTENVIEEFLTTADETKDYSVIFK